MNFRLIYAFGTFDHKKFIVFVFSKKERFTQKWAT